MMSAETHETHKTHTPKFIAEFPVNRPHDSGMPMPYCVLNRLPPCHGIRYVCNQYPIFSDERSGHIYYIALRPGEVYPWIVIAKKIGDQYLHQKTVDLNLCVFTWFWRDPSGHFCVLGVREIFKGKRFDMLVTINPETLEVTETLIKENVDIRLFHTFEGLIVRDRFTPDQRRLLSCRGIEEYHGYPYDSSLCLEFGTFHLESGGLHLRIVNSE